MTWCRRPWFNSWVGKIPWREDRLSTLVFSGFPGGSDGKESTCNVGDLGLIPGLGKYIVLSCSVVSDSLWPHGLQLARLLSLWDSPGKNTGVGCHSYLQGIFPTQGSNPSLPHCRQLLYQFSHQGSPTILKWVAYPFSRGSSWPRNRTRVSCIAGDSLPAELPGKPLTTTYLLFLIFGNDIWVILVWGHGKSCCYVYS